MKIVRFNDLNGNISYGFHEDEKIEVAAGELLRGLKPSGRKIAAKDVKLLAPIEPCTLLAIGKNYKAHVKEGGEEVLPPAPLLFIKATSSVIGPGEEIVIPAVAPEQVDYEAELVVVIGKTARNVKEKDAFKYVLGYTCANDVSARDCQFKDGQWARGKSFDTFAPLGPWIETDLDPSSQSVKCRINGTTLQDSNTSLMIFNVAFIISYLSAGMTLLPGTVILTGTPSGVGFARKPPIWLKPGDKVEVEVGGIGTLSNPVVGQKSR